MTHDEVYRRAAEQGGHQATEFHIVGGLHPELSLDWYLEMLRGLKELFPRTHLKAFTAIEIGWFAKRE
jgi:aminodeoxyfutalosine synthase